MPDSSGERLRPRPKKSVHMRFTATRAVRGFSADTVHFARSSRVGRPAVGGSGGRNAGVAGVVTGPVASCQLPRGRTRTVRGGPAAVTSTRGTPASNAAFRFKAVSTAPHCGLSCGALSFTKAASAAT